MLEHADGEASQEIDERDDHAGHSLAPHKSAGAVHAGEEVGLPLQFLPLVGRLLAGDRSRLGLGIDGHLAAGQTVEGKAGSHFAGAGGSRGDHHKLNNGDDGEDHRSHHQIVGCHKLAEGVDHFAGGTSSIDRRAGEHQPRGGYVEDESNERRAEHKRGEDTHLQRRAGREGPQQRQHRDREIGCQEQVDQQRRHRGQHHHHRQQDRHRQREIQHTRREAAGGGCCGVGVGHGTFSDRKAGRPTALRRPLDKGWDQQRRPPQACGSQLVRAGTIPAVRNAVQTARSRQSGYHFSFWCRGLNRGQPPRFAPPQEESSDAIQPVWPGV